MTRSIFEAPRVDLAVMDAESTSIMPTYKRFPVQFVRGDGCTLWDVDGNEYLDCLAGVSVVSVGHCHPEVTRAVAAQMDELVHVSNIFYTAPQVGLAERLRNIKGWGKVFLSNSGAEANECALKLARLHGLAHLGIDSSEAAVVSLTGSFHGRTMATLTLTAQPDKHEGFEPLLEGVRYVEPGDEAGLRNAMAGACAVFVEVLQGEGGVVPIDPGFIELIRDLCDSSGALLVMDEVQTGLCRTGDWLASDVIGVEPDVYTLGKALGNGLPVAATVARDDVAELLGPGKHGSTMGGGPVVSRAALAVLDVMKSESLAERALVRGEQFREQLKGVRGVKSTRGMGLLLAAELDVSATEVTELALLNGLVVNAVSPTAVRIAPPLTISEVEVDVACDRLNAAIEEASK